MAKVTVIVLAFQHEAFIGRCLESVLAQRTRHELEILIGEDGSTDATGALCDAYAARDPRITVFHRGTVEKWRIEGHVTGRRNCLELIRTATGEFVTLLDGDDGWLDPGRIDAQVDLLLADPAAAGCYHHTLIMDEAGRSQGRWRAHLPERMGLDKCIAPIAPFHTSSFLWRHTGTMRALLTEGDAWTAGSYDMYLFACAALQGDLVRYDADASFYLKHGAGISSSGLFARSNIHRLRILQWLRMDKATGNRWHDRIIDLCDRHLREVRSPVPWKDGRLWLRTIAQQPGYFLRPWRTRSLLSHIRKGLFMPVPSSRI